MDKQERAMINKLLKTLHKMGKEQTKQTSNLKHEKGDVQDRIFQASKMQKWEKDYEVLFEIQKRFADHVKKGVEKQEAKSHDALSLRIFKYDVAILEQINAVMRKLQILKDIKDSKEIFDGMRKIETRDLLDFNFIAALLEICMEVAMVKRTDRVMADLDIEKIMSILLGKYQGLYTKSDVELQVKIAPIYNLLEEFDKKVQIDSEKLKAIADDLDEKLREIKTLREEIRKNYSNDPEIDKIVEEFNTDGENS